MDILPATTTAEKSGNGKAVIVVHFVGRSGCDNVDETWEIDLQKLEELGIARRRW